MNKFKIIEESRFLKQKEMAELKGGTNPYDDSLCPRIHDVTCAKIHGTCIGVPNSYHSFCESRDHICGIMTQYSVYCVNIDESCHILMSYTF